MKSVQLTRLWMLSVRHSARRNWESTAWWYRRFPKVMDLRAASETADTTYYDMIHKDCQKDEAADFRVKKYQLDFSVVLNLTGSAKVYVDRSELKSYRFTLYHGYKVKQVTDQTGAALDFRREYDYVTVTRGGAAVEYLCLEYTG